MPAPCAGIAVPDEGRFGHCRIRRAVGAAERGLKRRFYMAFLETFINVVTIVGMLVPLADYSFAACLVAFALLGIGNTILQVSLNPLLTNVVDSRALSSSLTAGQVIKAVSSFSGPFIAAFAASKLGNWVWMFPIFAGISLVSALWLMATPIDEGPAERTSSAGELLAVLRDRKITMLFLGIVAIVGIDVGLNTLAPKLLIERCDMPLEQAGYGSSVYFFCRVVGAFVGSLLLTRLSDRKYYVSHMLLGLVVLCALYFAGSRYAVLAGLGVAGFAFSSIFAVIYSQALKHLPARANEISGLMIMGVFGGAVVPPLMGVVTDAVDSQAGSLAVLTLFALYLLACVPMIRSEKTDSHGSMRAVRTSSSGPCAAASSSPNRCASPRTPTIWTAAWPPWSRASARSSRGLTRRPWPSASPSRARPTIRTESSAATCPTSRRSATAWPSGPSSR